MREVIGTSNAKLFLFGEHFVVYEKQAILININKTGTCICDKIGDTPAIYSDNFNIHHNFKSVEQLLSFTDKVDELWSKCEQVKDFTELSVMMNELQTNYLIYAVGKTLKYLNVKESLLCKFNSEIPLRKGLGSSASLAVSVVGAVSTTLGYNLTKDEINKIAFEIEKAAHGTPSGADNSACTYGSIYFNKDEIIPLFNYVSLLNPFLLIDTGTRPPTSEAVQKFRKKYNSHRERYSYLFNGVLKQGFNSLKENEQELFVACMNKNQELLSELGVSTQLIDKLQLKVKRIGGALKITGAGCGGYCLAYHPNKDKLKDIMKLMNEMGLSWEIVYPIAGGIQIYKNQEDA